MALTSPALSSVISANLAATGNSGIAVPQFSLGIASGVVGVFLASVVNTIDIGVAGAGTSLTPIVMSSATLFANFLNGFAAFGLTGTYAPQVLLGVSNGISQGLLSLGLMQVTHIGVGSGTGVARISSPPSTPFMTLGFASSGVSGVHSGLIASALGLGLDLTIASFLQPGVVIVGSGSPTASSGVGVGSVI